MKYGALLPHFGHGATWERVFTLGQRLEAWGYDSVWVRDHLDYRPHEFEPGGRMFIDPFIALSAVAATTETLGLGTAVLTPMRHPLLTAQAVGALSFLSKGRLQLGLGPGTPRRPWELIERPYDDRVALCRETGEVIRLLSSGKAESYEAEHTKFQDVTLDPAPPRDMLIWYGGASPTAMRALDGYADGIMPARCPLRVLDDRVVPMIASARAAGRPARLAVQPLVSIAATRNAAINALPLEQLAAAATKRWRSPFSGLEDLRGAVVAGDPDDCRRQIAELEHRGAELFIVDLRLDADRLEDAYQAFAENVIR